MPSYTISLFSITASFVSSMFAVCRSVQAIDVMHRTAGKIIIPICLHISLYSSYSIRAYLLRFFRSGFMKLTGMSVYNYHNITTTVKNQQRISVICFHFMILFL